MNRVEERIGRRRDTALVGWVFIRNGEACLERRRPALLRPCPGAGALYLCAATWGNAREYVGKGQREKGNAPTTLEEPELRDLVVVVQHDRLLGVLVPTADRDGENLHGT